MSGDVRFAALVVAVAEVPKAKRAGGEPDSGDHRQSVGAHRRSKGGTRGYDAAKRITGRKRHILTDTDGRLLAVRVHAADVQDRDGAKLALKASRTSFPFVQTVFADGGYAGRLEVWHGQRPTSRSRS